MGRLLIYGNFPSPLVQPRGQIGLSGGHQVLWFSTHPVQDPPAHVHQLPPRLRQSLILRSLAEPLYLRRLIRQQKPDLVHVHYASKGTGVLGLTKRQPIIVSAMGSDVLPEAGYRGMYQIFTKAMLNKAEIITSKSEEMDEAILAIGDYGNKLERITWGVDLSLFQRVRDVSALRERLALPENGLVLLDPRGGTQLYNKDGIIRAFAEFVDNTAIAATLIICVVGGHGGYVERLKQLAQSLGIQEKVRFVGQIPRAEMPAYFSLADITISIPESDGLSQSLLECMACGSFPVFSDFPQYRALIESGRNGWLVPARDTSALAATLATVATNQHIREDSREPNRKLIAQHFDSREQNQRVLDLYRQLLS